MKYAIHAKITGQDYHFIVENQKVLYKTTYRSLLRIPEVKADSYLIHAGRMFYEPELAAAPSFHADQKAYYKGLIANGVTTLATTFRVKDHRFLHRQYKKARHLMINSPIDYALGVRVNIRYLTPKLYSRTAMAKLPYMVVEWKTPQDLFQVAWEWIRDSGGPRAPFIIPDYKGDPKSRIAKKANKAMKQWLTHGRDIRLKHLPPWKSSSYLPLSSIKSLGYYPQKGQLHAGSDCDYQLTLLDDTLNINYHESNRPAVVVLRGELLYVNDVYNYKPGFGAEVKGSMPGRFAGVT